MVYQKLCNGTLPLAGFTARLTQRFSTSQGLRIPALPGQALAEPDSANSASHLKKYEAGHPSQAFMPVVRVRHESDCIQTDAADVR